MSNELNNDLLKKIKYKEIIEKKPEDVLELLMINQKSLLEFNLISSKRVIPNYKWLKKTLKFNIKLLKMRMDFLGQEQAILNLLSMVESSGAEMKGIN